VFGRAKLQRNGQRHNTNIDFVDAGRQSFEFDDFDRNFMTFMWAIFHTLTTEHTSQRTLRGNQPQPKSHPNTSSNLSTGHAWRQQPLHDHASLQTLIRTSLMFTPSSYALREDGQVSDGEDIVLNP
jgi:hypothetical protein